MTQAEAYEANMKAAHEALVEAKVMLHAASQQAPDDRREDATELHGLVCIGIGAICAQRFD